jgi:hypothetical protein
MASKTTNKKTKSGSTQKVAPVATEEKVVVEEIVETPKKAAPVAKSPKKFAPNDTIECRSVTGGSLILVGPKTHLQYTWEDYGDTAWVEYQDLQALQSRKSNFLTKPRFIIEDEELVEQWSAMLNPIYTKVVDQTVEDFFELPLNKFKAQLSIMPDGLKDAIKTKAVQMIKTEELYDIRKVREIDAAWGTDFVEMFMK